MRFAVVGIALLFALPFTRTGRADELHVDVHHRTTVDTHWSSDPVAPSLAEDVVRSWLRTTLSAAGGTATRYRLDVRLDLETRAKDGLKRSTYLYDAIPLAAYVDVPIGQKLRIKLGEQIVSWGRMDLASAADVLDRRDLRTPLDPTHLPTPTIRADFHGAIGLSLAWSVVSRPHRFDLAGSSWSVLNPGILGTVAGRDTLHRIATSTDASTFMRVQDAFLQASSATPRIDGGDVAARATAHLGGADLALTYGYARTKLPILTVDQSLVDLITRGDLPSALALVRALDEGRPLVTSDYPRVHQLALDLEGTAGPFVLSWELGFSPSRPLYVRDRNGIPARADTPLAQGGLRAQYTRGETFAWVTEVDYFVAVKANDYLLFHRALFAASTLIRDVLARKHAVEGGALFTSSGPSVALTARYGYELSETWTIGCGATFFPRLREKTSAITLADVQVGRDYVELFVRARL